MRVAEWGDRGIDDELLRISEPEPPKLSPRSQRCEHNDVMPNSDAAVGAATANGLQPVIAVRGVRSRQQRQVE